MIVWMFTSIFPPYTGGAASCADIIIRKLSGNDDVRRVVLVTEYHRGAIIQRLPKCTIMRILPRRDSLRKEERSADPIRFAITHAVIATLLVVLAFCGRRHVVSIHGRLIYRWTGGLVKLLRLRAIADVRDLFGDARRYAKFPVATAASMNIAEMLRPVMGAQRVFYIPVAVENATSKLSAIMDWKGFLSEGEYFLFVGTLSEGKGVRELVEAYLKYEEDGGERHLVIVGEDRLIGGPLEVRGSTRIHVMGSVPRDGVYYLMARADRVILPSKSEGLPRVCLEAMALRTPVVCPPCVAEFEKYCPQCVLPEISPAAILGKLKLPREALLASNFPLEDLDAEKVVKKILDLYERVIQPEFFREVSGYKWPS